MRAFIASCATAIAALAVAVPATASGAPTVLRVTLVVHEAFTGGTVLETNIPGCAPGAPVATVDQEVRVLGKNWMFTGFKLVDCGAAGTFTFSYRAVARTFCSPHDYGSWAIVGGTGSFADVSGGGRLIGTYTPAGACPPPGIDDAWSGVMIFR